MPLEYDLASGSTRELNKKLHALGIGNKIDNICITNPNGAHALAVGLTRSLKVNIKGHVGYYCAGMNQIAEVNIDGNAGPAVAENMMSGYVTVTGNVSHYAGATSHGGTLLVCGDASSRCGISLKGADIIVKGSVGHMSAFMAQTGRMVICGDAGETLGDSIYETQLYVRGSVASLGTDCVQKSMTEKHKNELETLLVSAGITGADAAEFSRFGSARKLYNFKVDNADAY